MGGAMSGLGQATDGIKSAFGKLGEDDSSSSTDNFAGVEAPAGDSGGSFDWKNLMKGIGGGLQKGSADYDQQQAMLRKGGGGMQISPIQQPQLGPAAYGGQPYGAQPFNSKMFYGG